MPFKSRGTLLAGAFALMSSWGAGVGCQTQSMTQPGVVAQVKKCGAGWCRVIGNGFDGWIEQQRLWGVYADEKVE